MAECMVSTAWSASEGWKLRILICQILYPWDHSVLHTCFTHHQVLKPGFHNIVSSVSSYHLSHWLATPRATLATLATWFFLGNNWSPKANESNEQIAFFGQSIFQINEKKPKLNLRCFHYAFGCRFGPTHFTPPTAPKWVSAINNIVL